MKSVENVVDAAKRLVTVKFGKTLTVSDIEQYAKGLGFDPSFRPDYSEIVDLTQVEEVELQANEFFRLADEIDPFSPARVRGAKLSPEPCCPYAQGTADAKEHRDFQLCGRGGTVDWELAPASVATTRSIPGANPD